MSTSIVLLDQNFNANDVDIMVFETYPLFPPAAGIDDMVRNDCSNNAIPYIVVKKSRRGRNVKEIVI